MSKKSGKGKKTTRDSDSNSNCVVEDTKSIKYDLVPAWTKPKIKQNIAPSLCHFLGIQENLWLLDTDEYKFLDLVQAILDEVFLAKRHQLTKKDIVTHDM